MRILVIQGSPRKNGNTATLSHKLLEGLAQTGAHEVHEFWLNDMAIRPCQACFHCAGSGRCVIEDDMQQLYPEFALADQVVFAIPIFWWHMSAQMKLCFDRMTALLSGEDKVSALVGKHLVLIVSYNFRHCAEATLAMFEEFKQWLGVTLDVVEYHAQQGPALACPPKLDEAFNLGSRLALRVGKL